MPRSRAETTAVATSQELLRSALHRSQRRNTWVARRRLAWRWSVFLLGRGLLYLGPPLALAAGAAWWWRQSATVPAPLPALAPASAASAAQAVPETPPAVVTPAASATLQLRLDDEVRASDPRPRNPRLPLRTPEAASAAAAQESM